MDHSHHHMEPIPPGSNPCTIDNFNRYREYLEHMISPSPSSY